jgi:hypothetical protein
VNDSFVVGALIASVKVNQQHPDEVVVTLKVPGDHKMKALALATQVGCYVEEIRFSGFSTDRDDSE